MDYRNLSSMQLDALREVFNIGSGNAATSLSFLALLFLYWVSPYKNSKARRDFRKWLK